MLQYPVPVKVDQVDNYHGTKISDPYRWMEDTNSNETLAWVKSQQELSKQYFSNIKTRQVIHDRITELWDYEKYGVPVKKSGKYFYSKNDGLQNQSVLYIQDSLQSEARVLLDPNTFSEDGTIALKDYSVSNDGQLLAYGISVSGSDWEEWRFKNIVTGEVLPDTLEWVKFSKAVWSKDGQGVYYSVYDAPAQGEVLEEVNKNQKLYFHKIGTKQADDVLVYSRPDKPDWGYGVDVSNDGRYLILSVWMGTHRENAIFYKDLSNPQSEFIELFDKFDASYVFLGALDSKFYFESNLNAPNSKIFSIDVAQLGPGNVQDVVSERDMPISAAELVGNRIIVKYLKDVIAKVISFDVSGKNEHEIKLPGLGSVSGFHGETDSTETFFEFSAYTQAATIYRYDMVNQQYTVFQKPKINFESEGFVSKQVFYKSYDGTRIPMIISHKKGLKLSSDTPAILYGYGGFNVSLKPYFNPAYLAWMELGGVYAVANLRGGGEYGDRWHEAGMLHNKQNVFDDFYAAAEYLSDNNYTSAKRLAIHGGSNGGLLVGAAITQRPELFAATAPAVGVMDMLRFQKFTIGWAWVSDYGSSDNKDDFEVLLKYSPLHNLESRNYPPTLIMTSEQDDRVVPSHSFKFAATMQSLQQGDAPIIARIESKAGHGAGTSTEKVINSKTDMFTFFLENMGIRKISIQ